MAAVYNITVIVDGQQATAQLERVNTALNRTGATATRTHSTFSRLVRAFTATFIVHEIKKVSDAFLQTRNNLLVAGYSIEGVNRGFQKMFELSQRTRTPLLNNSELFRQISFAGRELQLTEKDLLDITEANATALALLGTSGQRATAATIQLSHALQEPIIRSRQWTALLVDNSVLLYEVAAAMGTTVDSLTRLVKAGGLTNREFAQGIIKALDGLKARFSTTIPTIAQSIDLLRNSLAKFVSDVEQRFGALSIVSFALATMARNIDIVLPLVINLGAVIAAIRFAAFVQGLFTAGQAMQIFGQQVQGSMLGFGKWATIITAVITVLIQLGNVFKIPGSETVTWNQAIVATIQYTAQWVGGLQNLLIILGYLGTGLATVTGFLSPWIAMIGAVTAGVYALTGSIRLTTIAATALGIAFLQLRFGAFTSSVLLLGRAFGAVVDGIGKAIFGLAAYAQAAVAATIANAGLIIPIVAATIAFGALVVVLLRLLGVTKEDAIRTFAETWEGIAGFVARAAEAIEGFLPGLSDAIEASGGLGDGFEAAQENAEGLLGQLKNINGELDAANEKGNAFKDWLKELDDSIASGSGGGSSGSHSLDIAEGGAGALVIGNDNTVRVDNTYTSSGSSDGGSGGGGGGGGGGSGPDTSTLTFPNYFRPEFNPQSGQFEQGPNLGFGNAARRASLFNPSFTAEELGPRLEAMNSALQSIEGFMQQQLQATGQWGGLNHAQLQIIALQTGLSIEEVRGIHEQAMEHLKVQQQIFELQQREAEARAREAARAQEAERKRQELEQRRLQLEQAYNQSLEQTLLQAMNALGVDGVNQLPREVQQLADQIARLQRSLVDTQNPLQRAETGRRIQVLTDRIAELTGSTDDLNSTLSGNNPYLLYAQNVYEKITGTASDQLKAANEYFNAVNKQVSAGANNGLINFDIGSGASSGGGSSGGGGGSSNKSKNKGVDLTRGLAGDNLSRLVNEAMGRFGGSFGSGFGLKSFAEGGEFDVPGTGKYPFAAFLHGGEEVRVRPRSERDDDEGEGKTININMTMNVTGVQDADSFRRSEKQIMSSLARRLDYARSIA